MRGPSLYSRIGTLERRLTPTPTECPECGGPYPGQNMLLCVKKNGKPRWGACKACGLALNKDGRPLSAIGLIDGRRIGPVEVFEPDRWWMFDCV